MSSQPPWMQTPPEADPLEADPPLVMWPVMHAGKPSTPLPSLPGQKERNTPVKTSPSRNYCCGR